MATIAKTVTLKNEYSMVNRAKTVIFKISTLTIINRSGAYPNLFNYKYLFCGY